MHSGSGPGARPPPSSGISSRLPCAVHPRVVRAQPAVQSGTAIVAIVMVSSCVPARSLRRRRAHMTSVYRHIPARATRYLQSFNWWRRLRGSQQCWHTNLHSNPAPHSKTLPCMSYNPNGFGGNDPTGEVKLAAVAAGGQRRAAGVFTVVGSLVTGFVAHGKAVGVPARAAWSHCRSVSNRYGWPVLLLDPARVFVGLGSR